MLSAREFYYSVVAPEEAGKNYQEVHQKERYEKLATHEDVSIIIGHVPKLSNDLLIEDYMEHFISTTSGNLADQISQMFVAKRRNFLANAGACHAKGQYEGDLIFFYVGLSDLCFQYAILFSEYKELCTLRQKFSDSSETVLWSMARVITDLENLASAQLEWGINSNEIRLKDETLLYPPEHLASNAANIASLMDRIVLGHEVSHHLLGHTGRYTTVSEILESHITPFIEQNVSERHRREIEADLLGLTLPVLGISESDLDQAEFEVALGALLFYTVLSHLKCHIFLENESHPSAATRYDHVLRFIRSNFKCPVLSSVIDDIERFQALLFSTQDRGLGIMQKHRLQGVG